MIETLKAYAWLIKLIAVTAIIGVIAYSVMSYGNGRNKAGKDEIQALWDKDKADRKAAADLQAADTLNLNKGNEDAFRKTQADLRDSRSNLNVALQRLRDLPALSVGEGLLLAGGGHSEASVPGVASDTGGSGIRVEQRIGSCEDTSSEPCFVNRGFFEQALSDAVDRGIVRQWASGQGIKTVGGQGK